jgi:predicted DNA-binding protein (UPF0251 family)
MPRTSVCLCKNIKFEPQFTFFKPKGVKLRDLEVINITKEEIEAYRLRHLEKKCQKEAAKTMKTSQSTYQRILYSAYEKIADSLINGKGIKMVKHY